MFDKINEWQERIETFREQVQSKEKKPRKIQSKFQKHASKFYILMCVFTICGYLFFSFSRSIFKDDSPMLDTGIGVASKTKIGSSEVEILSRKVNEDSGYGEVGAFFSSLYPKSIIISFHSLGMPFNFSK